MADDAARTLRRSHLSSTVGVAAAMVAVGCGVSTTPPAATAPVATTAATEPVRVVVDVPLTFEAAGGRPLPVPMVEAEIRGTRTRLIVDSGASDHVLTSATAARIGLQPGAAVAGSDHAGATFDAARLPDATVRLGSEDVPLDGLHSLDGPPPFEPLGIGGFLAPQKLFTSGYVVMDQPGRRLLRLSTDDEAGALAWMRSTYGGGEVLQTRYCQSGKPFATFQLDGHPAVLGELDTGGSETELLAAKVGARDATGECAGIGVSGKCVEARALDGVTVRFAGRSFGPRRVQVVAAMDHGKGIDDEGGLLGADILRQCVLAFPQRRQSAVLAVCPAAGGAPRPEDKR